MSSQGYKHHCPKYGHDEVLLQTLKHLFGSKLQVPEIIVIDQTEGAKFPS